MKKWLEEILLFVTILLFSVIMLKSRIIFLIMANQIV